MKKNRNISNRGFSLAEVLVATIVMSMIMGSVLSFVQYAGTIWQKGSDKISSDNYTKAAFELIKQELLEATSITRPASDNFLNAIEYKKMDSHSYIIGVANNKLVRVDKTANKTIYIARNVLNFMVVRPSKRTLEISIQIIRERSEDELYDDDGEEIPPEIVASDSMVLIAPQIN